MHSSAQRQRKKKGLINKSDKSSPRRTTGMRIMRPREMRVIRRMRQVWVRVRRHRKRIALAVHLHFRLEATTHYLEYRVAIHLPRVSPRTDLQQFRGFISAFFYYLLIHIAKADVSSSCINQSISFALISPLDWTVPTQLVSNWLNYLAMLFHFILIPRETWIAQVRLIFHFKIIRKVVSNWFHIKFLTKI